MFSAFNAFVCRFRILTCRLLDFPFPLIRELGRRIGSEGLAMQTGLRNVLAQLAAGWLDRGRLVSLTTCGCEAWHDLDQWAD